MAHVRLEDREVLLKLLEKREKVDEDAEEGGRLDGGDLGSEDAFSGGDLGCLNDSAFWSLLHDPDILSFSSFDRKSDELMFRVWVCKWKKSNEPEMEKKRWQRREEKNRERKKEKNKKILGFENNKKNYIYLFKYKNEKTSMIRLI